MTLHLDAKEAMIFFALMRAVEQRNAPGDHPNHKDPEAEIVRHACRLFTVTQTQETKRK